MLLRRFTIINYLPVAAIQGQALARKVIEVRDSYCRTIKPTDDVALFARRLVQLESSSEGTSRWRKTPTFARRRTL